MIEDVISSHNGAHPMTARDDQFVQALQSIQRTIEQNRSAILSRDEYEKRHEDLKQRLTDLSIRVDRIETNIDKKEDRSLSSFQAILFIIVSSALSSLLSAVTTLLIHK